MKLIYVANVRMPTEKAHGIQIMKMCEAFSRLKIGDLKQEVELILPIRFNKIKEDPFKYYRIEKKFKIKKIPCLDLIYLDFIFGNLALWVQTVTFLIFVKIYLIFKKYDILYTREPFMGLFFKNYILEVHQFPVVLSKKAKKFVVLTTFIKKALINKKRIDEDKILVSPDGVDINLFDIQCSIFEAREKLNLPKGKKIVIYTGHLYKWKGTQILIEASKYLSDDVEIYLVGGTNDDIKEFKFRCANARNVQIVGYRPHFEISYWLKSADVLVLPNTAKVDISKYWASPMKMFEYMASKKPIVASDLPSIREILNESNAVLFKPDDPKALAGGIKKVLESPELAEKISNQAFKDVQEYTWQKRAEKILKFIS